MRTIYYGPRDRSKQHHIDVLDFRLDVVLCHSVKRACQTRQKELQVDMGESDPMGMVAYRGRHAVIFLAREYVSHDLIAHECRHAVDRILAHNGVRYGRRGDGEVSALAQGHITALVYKDLKRWKVRIK